MRSWKETEGAKYNRTLRIMRENAKSTDDKSWALRADALEKLWNQSPADAMREAMEFLKYEHTEATT